MEDFLGLRPLIWAQTSTLSPTNGILTQTGASGYTNTHTHAMLCCANTSKCRCSSQDKCEHLPSVPFQMVLRSQMPVRGCMFVTKCFTYRDQGRSSRTQTLHMCADRRTMSLELQLRPKRRTTDAQRRTKKPKKTLFLLDVVTSDLQDAPRNSPKLQLLVLPETSGLLQY